MHVSEGGGGEMGSVWKTLRSNPPATILRRASIKAPQTLPHWRIILRGNSLRGPSGCGFLWSPAGVLACFLAIMPCPLHAQSPGQILKRALWETPAKDAAGILARPFQDRGTALRNTGILLGLIAVDPWTTRQFQEHLEPWGEDIRSFVELPSLYGDSWFAGGIDGYAYTAVAGMYAAGVLSQNVKLQEAGLLTTKAILETYVVSHLVLKTVFGRNRPNHPLRGGELEEPFTRNPWDFFNWHRVNFRSDADGTAMPSWHSALYFSIARVMSLEFDNVWIPYTVSLFPLLYDIDGHRHWVSDLVAGAVVGSLIGTAVFENYHGTTKPEGGGGVGGQDTFQLQRPSRWRDLVSRLSWRVAPDYGRLAASVWLSF